MAENFIPPLWREKLMESIDSPCSMSDLVSPEYRVPTVYTPPSLWQRFVWKLGDFRDFLFLKLGGKPEDLCELEHW